MKDHKRIEEAQAHARQAHKMLSGIGAQRRSGALDKARAALTSVEDSLIEARKEARRLDDPLERVAAGEPLSKELRQALSVPE